MKTILITGINGFLGSHLAKALKKEYNIIGLEYTLNNLFRLKEERFKIYSSKDDIEKIFIENEIFAVVHAATVYRRNNEPLKTLIDTNILLPVRLFEFANKYNSKIFLNTDSFFNNPEYNYSYLPDYTLSKKQVLEWLRLITNKCKLVNMKIFHMYGPGDSPTKFIPSIIKKLKNNEPFINLTRGEQIRDFVYIEDVLNAYLLILKGEDKIDDFYSEFEIGTGLSTSVKQITELIKKLVRSRTELRFGELNYRENEIMKAISNNYRLMEFGWAPIYKLEKGILETIKFY